MASMTDYVEQQLMQESAQVEAEKSEEELSAAILESYLSMSAAFATIENVFECANICAFCESAEIDKPTEAAVIVESFWDSVKNVFETIIDWFKSVIQGLIGLFTSAKLQKLIAKLKTLDGNKVVKIDTNIGAMLFATEFIYLELENFKEKCIDNIPEQSTVDDLIEELEKIVAVKKWDATTISNFQSQGTGTKLGSEVKGPTINGNDEIAISDIIKALEEINRMNMPKRGSALLKSLKFDEKKYVEDDDKTEGKEKVNRELVNSIKKLSRLLAKGYDKITSGLVKVTEIAFHNEKVDEKSDAYKENLKEAQEARKNKVDYNKDEDSSNRPKMESAVEEPESAETETVTESAKVDSTDAYFD
jgi:hypothetical protein